MKIHEFISTLDEAKYGGRRVAEEKEVADSPSHAPTSTKQWKTPTSGKSEDEGEKVSKDAIKKSDSAIPSPVAKAPSHAPTSTAQWKTKGDASSDEGEKVSKEAMKENLLRTIIDSEGELDVAALISQADNMQEGGHAAGCKCGFCKNKGSFGKKKDEKAEKDSDADDGEDKMNEDHSQPMGHQLQPPVRRPMKHRTAPQGRMGFRHPAAPRPKAAMAPYQPSMEALDSSKNTAKTIQEMADKLLESPGKK